MGQLEDPQRAGCRGTGMGASGLGPLTTYATQSCSGSEYSGESPHGTDESTSRRMHKAWERSRQTSHGDSGPDPAAPLLGSPDPKGQTMQGADRWGQEPLTFRMSASRTPSTLKKRKLQFTQRNVPKNFSLRVTELYLRSSTICAVKVTTPLWLLSCLPACSVLPLVLSPLVPHGISQRILTEPSPCIFFIHLTLLIQFVFLANL